MTKAAFCIAQTTEQAEHIVGSLKSAGYPRS